MASSIGFTQMWLWDVDSNDWKHKQHKIIKEVEGGLANCRKQTRVVLFHDLPTTVVALEELLLSLQDKGYAVVDFPGPVCRRYRVRPIGGG